MSNYDYISQELCVEKDKPVNDCKGSCHLKFQIEKETETSSSQKAQFLEKVEYTPHISANLEFVFISPESQVFFKELNCILFSTTLQIDPPPPKSFS